MTSEKMRNNEFKYKRKKRSWDNAPKLHKKVTPFYTNKKPFKNPITGCHLVPGIPDPLPIKNLGDQVPLHYTRYENFPYSTRWMIWPHH